MNKIEDLKSVIDESFTQYAGAVLQSRALVDARDCLKPSARQIFYCLYTDKFLPNKPFKKTLKAIGSVARMYIHGDSSAEGVIMRAGQSFAMRYPLIEVEGNDGNLMTSGNWAASRYTASRLTELNANMFNDIDKNTIEEWRDNYDDTEKYPVVLPSKGFYNICNGSMGIGIGMACSIPQFNVGDVNRAMIYLIDHPDCDFEHIYCAPDFATGGVLLNEKEVKESLRKGTGAACKLRGKIEYDANERCYVVTEIPYAVYTNTICEELTKIIESEDNPGIEKFNDLTGINPLIKIYLTRAADPGKVLQVLWKETSLQSYYSVNMTMLEDGRYPKVFGWKEALQSHIDHEKIVYRRGFEFDVAKMKHRVHIIDGLLICLASIDEVVQTIKSSKSAGDASVALQKKFLLDEEQAKAVLDMKLSRLAHLEVEKLENERIDLQHEIDRITAILNDETLFNDELKKGWKATISRLADRRRTQIFNVGSAEETDSPVQNNLFMLWTDGSTASIALEDATTAIKTGGVYSKFIPDKWACDHGNKMYILNTDGTVSENRMTETAHLFEYIPSKEYIVTVSEMGFAKRTPMSEYKKLGSLCKVKENDKLFAAICANAADELLVWTEGKIVRLPVSEIKESSRMTIGTKISSNNILNIWLDTPCFYTVNEKGQYKRTYSKEIKNINVNLNEGCVDVGPCNDGTAFVYINKKFRELDWSTVTIHTKACDGAKLTARNFKAEK